MKRPNTVAMSETTVTLDVQPWHEDAHPDIFQKLRRWTISYPYPRNERTDSEWKRRKYRALVIENEYLRVTVLPELGGHLYSAYDKINGREVFHHMRKLRPRPLGRRGAWAPLGVEFNFPSSHSPTTLSPVDGVLRRNADGSASIVIGDVERVSRMAWSLDITLSPGVNAIEMTATLHNRTPEPQGYYWWTNVAIPGDKHTRFVIPINTTQGHGLPGSGQHWPIRHGVDYSWHRNIRHTMGVFGHGCREDFLGSWDDAHDWGMVHVADYRMLPGKKMFTWGMGPGGLRKSTEYSPGDGAYAELQAGIFEHQPSYDMIRAHATVRFDSKLIPLHGMKGPFTRANEQAAVTLRPADEHTVQIAACVTRKVPRCRIVLTRKGKTIFQTTRDLSPKQPLSHTVTLKKACRNPHDLELTLHTSDGVLISERPADPRAHAAPEAAWLDTPSHAGERSNGRGTNGLTIEQEHLRALSLHKMGLLFAAREAYARILERDPGHAATRLQLGRLLLYAGLPGEALTQFERALARDHQLLDAHYYIGLTRVALGDDRAAGDSFWILLRSSETDVRALMELGGVALRRGDYQQATDWFCRVAAINPDDTLAAGLLSAALRRQGRAKDALAVLAPAAERFPTSHLLAAETWLASKPAKDARHALKRLLDGNVDGWLELAADYTRAGLHDDALAVLDTGIAATRRNGQVYPMLHYWRGAVLERLGRAAQAKRACAAGARMNPDRCFPGRTESIAVLERALELSPEDVTAMSALGTILYHRTRRDEAKALWRRALRAAPRSFVLTSDLAIAAWEDDDLDRTAHYLEKACRIEPDNMRLILWLDHVLAESRQDRKRFRLLAEAYAKHPENDDLRESYGCLLLDAGKPRQTIELLAEHTFRTRHGVFSLTRLHMNTRNQIGLKQFRKGEWEKALDEFEEARKIPVQLGEDEGRFFIFGKSLYYAGLCLEKLGRKPEALQRYRKCGSEDRHWLPELLYYECMACRRLGKPKLAKKALDDLGKAVERYEGHRNARPAFVHHLKALYLRALGRSDDADREDRAAHRRGWRPSDEMEFKFRFGFS